MDANMTQAIEKVTKARTWLAVHKVFYGALLLGIEPDYTRRIATAATDGEKMYFNPEFVLGLSEDELRGVCAHEAMHCMLVHHLRRHGRDSGLWNEACDYKINQHLVADGFVLPEDGLFDSRYDADHWSVDDIYADLLKRQPPGGTPGTTSRPPQPNGDDGDGGTGSGNPRKGNPRKGNPRGTSPILPRRMIQAVAGA